MDLHHKAHIATIILIAQIHLRHIVTRRYLGGGVHTGRGRASFTLNAMHTQTFITKASGREQDSRCQINFAGSSSAICIHRRYTGCIRLTSVLLPIEDYHFFCTHVTVHVNLQKERF